MHRGHLYRFGVQLWVCVSWLLCMSSTHAAEPKPVCEVQQGRINSIRLGGSVDQVFLAFKGKFEISEKPESRTYGVTEKSTRRLWIRFFVNEKKKILIAYATGPCKTKEGIGPGS